MGQPGLRQGIHADTQYVELGCAKTLPRHVRVCPQKQHGTNKSDGLSFLSHFLWGCPRIFPSHSHKSLKIKYFPKHGSGFRTNSPQDPRFYRIHTRGAIVLVELTNTLADVEDIDVPPGRWQQPKKVGTNWTIGTIYIYTGWWYTYPSEKYEWTSVGMVKFPTEWCVRRMIYLHAHCET